MARVSAWSALCLACCAYALEPSLDVSQYAHTAWRVRDGFARGFIYAIAQTRDGYLWVGTEFGLMRFDGVKITPWQPPAGQHLPGVAVQNLLAARDGALWIGTLTGLARWNDGQLETFPELRSERISGLLEDHEGTVWIGTFSSSGKLCAYESARIQCQGEDGRFASGAYRCMKIRSGTFGLA